MEYSGARVLVSGGTGDLGQAIVRRLVAAGLKVAFTYRTQAERAARMVEELGSEQARAWPLTTASLEEARRLVRQVQNEWGPVHYLVNNAGVVRDQLFARLEEPDWREVMSVNLDLAFSLTRALIFDLLKHEHAAVVNISSVAALAGAAGQTNYAAAKAGLLGFTRALAREVGRFQLRVNAVAPGYLVSHMTDRLPDEVKTQALRLIPLGRFGEPAEAAEAVAFLLSDDARYIHGQVLVVDGGLVM